MDTVAEYDGSIEDGLHSYEPIVRCRDLDFNFELFKQHAEAPMVGVCGWEGATLQRFVCCLSVTRKLTNTQE